LGFFKGVSLSLLLCAHGIVELLIYEKHDPLGMFPLFFLILIFLRKKNPTRLPKSLNHFKLRPLLMGITATTLSNLAFYPLTTIRTRIQQEQFHFLENQTQVVDNQAKYNDVFDCIYKL